MALRTMVAGILLAVLTTACGSSRPPSGPGPTVTPPPDPGPGPAPTPATPPTLGITRILTFGDSMTAGTTSAAYTPFTLTPGIPQSYPFKLQLLLTARYTAQAITVSNAGVPGERATEVKPSTRDRFNRALSEARPELVILMEGANDLNLMNSTGLTDVSPVVAAIEDMVRDSLARGAQVIVTTLPPQRENSPKGGAGPLLAKFNRDMKTMAAKKGATLIDLNAMVPLSLIGQDGLHPTESAYEMIAGLFFNAIKSRFEVVTAATQ